MTYLEGFLEDTDANNRCIQRALREVETQDLLNAMCGLDEASTGAICRNMSKRACDALLEDLEAQKKSIGEARIRGARENFLRKIRKFKKYAGDFDAAPAEPAKGSLNAELLKTPSGIAEFFVVLGTSIKEYGLPAIDGLLPGCPDVLAAKGLEYLSDGLDPMLIRSLLERIKESMLRNLELRCAMMIEGFDSLALRDMPRSAPGFAGSPNACYGIITEGKLRVRCTWMSSGNPARAGFTRRPIGLRVSPSKWPSASFHGTTACSMKASTAGASASGSWRRIQESRSVRSSTGFSCLGGDCEGSWFNRVLKNLG